MAITVILDTNILMPKMPTSRILFDVEISDAAARIRADTGLRLPDAIIIATGLAKGAQYLVTHKKELKKASRHLETISSKELLIRLRHTKKK
jgi:predicted nucleic acid-binding protein